MKLWSDMIDSSKGIGGMDPTPSTTPINLETPGQVAMNTPVRTLADLKNVLISHLGEENGNLLYNSFISSIVSGGFTALQGASQQAANATKKMSQNQ